MTNITVIGAGSWGTALAHLLGKKGEKVLLWSRREEQVDEINHRHTNDRYLQGVISSNVSATTNFEEAVLGAELILFAVPTKGIRENVERLKDVMEKSKPSTPPILMHVTKGLEQGTNCRVSEIIEEVMGNLPYQGPAVLSGPSYATEVFQNVLTIVVVASEDEALAKSLQQLFGTETFRVYTNTDVKGVEFGGSLKNVLALCNGVLIGAGYGANVQAAMITRGIAEMSRFGVHFGAEVSTFSGLTGLGDLIVTSMGPLSRNRQAGIQIGQGKSIEEILDVSQMVVEGAYTVKVVHKIAQKEGISMPIMEAAYQVLYKGASIEKMIQTLMQRQVRSEKE